MKKTGAFFLLLAALLVAVPAYDAAWAAEREPDRFDNGWRHPAVAPEKQADFEKIMGEYRAAARPLYNDMWAKRTEFEYIARGDSADPKDISRMVAEMKSIREKCQALHDSTAGKLSKSLGISSEHAYSLLGGGFGHGGYGACGMGPGFGRGYGRGCDGPGWGGMGYGPRGPRGGHRGWQR